MNNYTKLHDGSQCDYCCGCSKLDIPKFKGIKPNVNKDYITCKDFRDGYSDEEKAKKLEESKEYYGALYDDNNY